MNPARRTKNIQMLQKMEENKKQCEKLGLKNKSTFISLQETDSNQSGKRR